MLYLIAYEEYFDSAIYLLLLFFAIDMLLHIHLNNIKSLSPGTTILGGPAKNIKRNS